MDSAASRPAEETKHCEVRNNCIDAEQLNRRGSRVTSPKKEPASKPPKRPTEKLEIQCCPVAADAGNIRVVNPATIGVIVPNLFDPFFVTCARGVLDVAKQHGYSAIITISVENSEMRQRQSSLMLRQKLDGLVIIPVSRKDLYWSCNAFSGVHLVTIGGPASGSRFDSVLVPNRSGAKSAVEHLIGHGHRSIAFLGLNRTLYTMKARYTGYRDAMSEAGYSPEPYIDCESPERTLTLIRSLMNSKKPVTAIFAANNVTMLYVLKALSIAGIHVPYQIALAGFDDLEMADLLQPSLTVIRQPVYQLGEAAASLLFQRILGSDVPKVGRRVVLPLELLVRSSCGCQPGSANSVNRQTPSLTTLNDE